MIMDEHHATPTQEQLELQNANEKKMRELLARAKFGSDRLAMMLPLVPCLVPIVYSAYIHSTPLTTYGRQRFCEEVASVASQLLDELVSNAIKAKP